MGVSVRAGVLGAYPNMFFVVPETQIDEFSSAVARLKSRSGILDLTRYALEEKRGGR
jgi:hypothetical protein